MWAETGTRIERGTVDTVESDSQERAAEKLAANGTPRQEKVPPALLEAEAEEALEHEKDRRYIGHLRERRQVHFARATAVGVIAGFIAVAFKWALFGAETIRGDVLAALRPYPYWGWAVLPAAAFAICSFAGWLMTSYAPSTSGSGIPHVEAVLLRLRPFRWRRVLPVKFIAGILGIGAGLSLGREGPTVQMGAAAAQGMAEGLKVPERSQPFLVASGAGAGLAAAFNAPLAGFIFVIEELQHEMSPITYGTGLIAALSAVIITRAFSGQLPSFHIHGYPTPPLSALPLVVVLGALCGLLGVVFNRTLMRTIRAFENWRGVPVWLKIGTMGAVVGLVAWWVPAAVGGGHQTAEDALRGVYTSTSFIILLLILKFALTMTSYGSGAAGGIFAPLLTMGALVGLLVGHIGAHWVPELASTPAAFGVLGMAALFTSIVRAPLTGIVLITEMTANYEQLFAVAIACLIAYLVAEHLGDKPIYEALLERDLRRSDPGEIASEEPVLVDVVVEARSEMDRQRVQDLGLPPGCLIVTLKRAGREIVPGGGTRLQAGDHIVFIVAGDAIRHIADVKAVARGR